MMVPLQYRQQIAADHMGIAWCEKAIGREWANAMKDANPGDVAGDNTKVPSGFNSKFGTYIACFSYYPRGENHIVLRRLFGLVVLFLLTSVALADAKPFRYAYRIDPASLDPHALAETFTLSWLGQIYEPLVGRGKNLELVPALATKWEQPDPTTWRFHLRPNVKFHSGEPFSADDVIFSAKRSKAEGADRAYTVAAVTEVKKIDDLTVDFIMAKPNPILPLQTTSTYMMSKAWSEANGAGAPASIKAKQENYATSNANGTGPFRIQARQVGVKTTLVPNPAWGSTPEHNLTEVVFTPIQSDATRVAALLSGEVDM